MLRISKELKKILLTDTLTSYFHSISQIVEEQLIDMAWRLEIILFTSGFKSTVIRLIEDASLIKDAPNLQP